MTDPFKTIRRPWWSYARLSLRGLVVLVLMMGAWLGWFVHTARLQRDTVAAIKKAGGYAAYDWEWENGDEIPDGRPLWPKWIVDRVGPDYFGTVVFVQGFDYTGASNAKATRAQFGNLGGLHSLKLSGPTVTDSDVSHLRGLANLRRLEIANTYISDGALACVDELPALEKLTLIANRRITGAGLAHVKRLTRLRTLDLSSSYIGDGGLIHLEGLKRLESLNLADNRVTDAGLISIVWLTNLRVLDLRITDVTDAGLVHIGALHSLQHLDLLGTKVGNGGLVQLKGLTKLVDLDLSNTEVTDSGLEHLRGLAGLKELRLHSTGVTAAGKRKLHAVLPLVNILP